MTYGLNFYIANIKSNNNCNKKKIKKKKNFIIN